MSTKKSHTLKEVLSKLPSDESSSKYSPGISATFTITTQNIETMIEFTNSFISNTTNNNIESVLNKSNLHNIFKDNQGKHIIVAGIEPIITYQEIIQ